MQALTPREYQVAKFVARGSSNKQIADVLSITEQTVKNHMQSIYRKLGVNNRVELTIYVTRRGKHLRPTG
jgi:DNA-binding NarL/FixJ family response regulator